jgi:hypothetical protein
MRKYKTRDNYELKAFIDYIQHIGGRRKPSDEHYDTPMDQLQPYPLESLLVQTVSYLCGGLSSPGTGFKG